MPGLLRAGRRLRPRRAADPRRARRRRLRDQRPEDLDQRRATAPTGAGCGPHRPGRAQAQGHPHVPARHEVARRHRPAADQHGRPARLQRGLLRQRARSRHECRGRGEPRLVPRGRRAGLRTLAASSPTPAAAAPSRTSTDVRARAPASRWRGAPAVRIELADRAIEVGGRHAARLPRRLDADRGPGPEPRGARWPSSSAASWSSASPPRACNCSACTASCATARSARLRWRPTLPTCTAVPARSPRGTSEIQRGIIATRGLGLPRSD